METRTCTTAPTHGGGAGGEPAVSGDAGTSGASTGAAGEGPTTCEADQVTCGSECVDVTVDVDHCGGCGMACDDDAVCQVGSCAACSEGQLACEGECVDPLADPKFCGASGRCVGEGRGVACGVDDVCQVGACVSDSAALQSLSLAPATLSPEFDPKTLAYKARFPFYTQHLTLAAATASAKASGTISGVPISAAGATFTPTPEEDLQSLRVDVKAESGAKQTYEVSLERAPVSTTYVKAFNSRQGFRYGSRVAIDGDTVVVGAPSEDGSADGIDGNDTTGGSSAADSGAAYVMFRGSNGKWARQAYVKADSSAAGARFADALSVDGDTLAIGAPGLRNAAGDGAGGVYIFIRSGTTWTQQAFVTSGEGAGWFGAAVALQGDHLVVSAPRSGLLGYEAGALFSYTRTGTTWKVDATLPNPPKAQLSSYSWFGYRLGFSGDRVIASGEQLDTVFVMLRTGSLWAVEQPINLPNGVLRKASVAIDGDTLAVSGPGVVHVFTRSGSIWSKQASLSSFNESATPGFGASLALEGDLLVLAGPQLDPPYALA